MKVYVIARSEARALHYLLEGGYYESFDDGMADLKQFGKKGEKLFCIEFPFIIQVERPNMFLVNTVPPGVESQGVVLTEEGALRVKAPNTSAAVKLSYEDACKLRDGLNQLINIMSHDAIERGMQS